MPTTIHAACNDTGWYTVVDLDGVSIVPCSDCNPDGMAVPMPEPGDELRTQILAAVHREMYESRRFTRGLLYGLLFSAPIWFVIVMVALWVLR